MFIFILAFILGLIFIYNKTIHLKNLILEAESGVDVQLKRRYDLVPNLVKTVSAYCTHESKTVEEVVRLRNQTMNQKILQKKENLENQFEQGLCLILGLKEDYPNLKADEAFLKIQKELSLIEDDLQHARRYYNGVVRKFNSFINLFPICLLKKTFKLSDKSFFQLEGSHEKVVPNVKDFL